MRYICQGDQTGYGVAATSLVRAFHAAGISVIYEPLTLGPALGLGYELDPTGAAGPADIQHLRNDSSHTDYAILHLVPEYYPYFIERERARGTRRIFGHAVWETDRLPAHWPELIGRLDGLIVPTEWNRGLFARCGIRVPIVVAPHVPQSPPRQPSAAEHGRIEELLAGLESHYLFYTVGTWLKRKGIDLLITAFVREFGHREGVALVIKTSPNDLESSMPVKPQIDEMVRRAAWRSLKRHAPIRVLTEQLTDGEIMALHTRGDCFTSLCRAEGWGLGAFEAAALGKPVIITGWGGPLAFLKQETAFLVEGVETPVRPARPNASYTAAQNWFEPKMRSARKAMRRVFRDPDSARLFGERARWDIDARFKPEKIARTLLADLDIAACGSHP